MSFETLVSSWHLGNSISRWASENLNVFSVNNSMTYDEILGEEDLAVCKDSFEGTETEENTSSYCFNVYYNNYNHHLVNNLNNVGQSLSISDIQNKNLFPTLSDRHTLVNLLEKGFQMSDETPMEGTKLIELLLLNIKDFYNHSLYYYSNNELSGLNSDKLQKALERFQINNSLELSPRGKVTPETLNKLFQEANITIPQPEGTEQVERLNSAGLIRLALAPNNPILNDQARLKRMTNGITLSYSHPMEATRLVQYALKTKGNYTGEINSLNSTELMKAVRAFQKENNITPTENEYIGRETWAALFQTAGINANLNVASN